MKLTWRRSRTTWMVSPVSSAPRPSAPPAQCSTALPAKWPPQRIRVRPGAISRSSPFQIDDRLIGSHHPRAIVAVQVDRDAAEGAAPLDHRAIEMRVRDRDRIDAALRLDGTQRCLVDQAHAVPQHVAADASHQQPALADRERRLDADADKARVLLAHDHAMALLQVAQRRPALALPADELALVGADRACARRLAGFRELHAAGDADRIHGAQGPSRGWSRARTSARTS